MRRVIPMLLLFGLGGLVVLQFAAAPLEQLQQQQGRTPAAAEFGADPAQQNFGYTPRPDETERFIRSLDKPTLREAAPELFQFQGEVGDEKPVLLYRALYEAHQQFIGQPFAVGKQGIGDCVSWGWKHAADVHLAVMWKLGDSGEWRPAATEPIYGGSRVEARGRQFAGWSDGSYGAAAAKWVKEWGILFRQDYPTADLKEYSAQRAKQWGAYGCGGQGDGGKLDTVAKEHPIRNVALVTSFEEAATAIRSGYPIPVCSSQGFSSTRDEQGFCRPSGTWMHCLVPGTMVSTIVPKACEEVVSGDLVITHTGGLKPVTEVITHAHDGQIARIKATGCAGLTVTTEHPVLIYRPRIDQSYCRPGIHLATYSNGKFASIDGEQRAYELTQPMWVPAGDVRVNDYLLTPATIERPPTESPSWGEERNSPRRLLPVVPDDDLAYLFGYYIANGHSTDGHTIVLTMPADFASIGRLKDAFLKLGLPSSVVKKPTYERLIAYSAAGSRSFLEWFGRDSSTKRIPPFLWSAGWNWNALLEGYTAGDGTPLSRSRYRVTTVSESLAQQLWLLAVALGKYPTMHRPPRGTNSYPNAKPAIAIEYHNTMPARPSTRYWRNYYCMPIRSVEFEDFRGSVYNYEVGDDESFLADGVAVHNCMAFIGVRYDRPGLLCLNSWGPSWVSGPKWPEDQPEGSFWVDANVATRMLSGRDSFAVSGYEGFPPRRLDHGSWVRVDTFETLFALAP